MSVSNRPSLPVGARVSRYEITGVLGEGGFAITYSAIDSLYGKPIALKELFPEGCRRNGYSVNGGPTFEIAKQGFVREAHVLLPIDHPNLVKFLDLIEINNTVYLALDFVPGPTAGAVLTENTQGLAESDVVSILTSVADALTVVHSAGVLHRDIKPDNIILSPRSPSGTGYHPVLVDFGAARQFLDRSSPMTGIVTQGYAPLEQYGRNVEIGPTADIYALAATGYHLLSGEPPTSAPDRYQQDDLEPITRHRSDVSPAVSALLLQALSMHPSERPQSAHEFASALRGQLVTPSPPTRRASQNAGQPPPLAVDSPVTRAPPTKSAFSRPFILASVGLLVAGSITGLALLSNRSAGSGNAGDAVARATTADSTPTSAAASSIAAPTVTSTSVPLVPATPVPTGTPTIAVALVASLGPAETIAADKRFVGPFAVLPGRQVLYTQRVGYDTQFFVLSATGGEPRKLTSSTTTKGFPAASADGHELAYLQIRDNKQSIVVSSFVNGLLERGIPIASEGAPTAPVFLTLAGLTRVYFAQLNGVTGHYEVASVAPDGTGTQVEFSSVVSDVYPMAPGSDGLLVSMSDGSQFDVGILKPGVDKIQIIAASPFSDARADESPNGRLIVIERTNQTDTDLILVDLKSGTEHQLTHTPAVFERNPRFVDDNTIAYIEGPDDKSLGQLKTVVLHYG